MIFSIIGGRTKWLSEHFRRNIIFIVKNVTLVIKISIFVKLRILTSMKRYLLLFIFALSCLILDAQILDAQSYNPGNFVYQVLSSSQGVAGERLLTIRCKCAGMDNWEGDVCRCAVHALLFTGCPPEGNLPQVKPIFQEEMTVEKQQFFDNFFSSEDCSGYVSKILSTNAKFIKGKKKATFIEVPVVVDTRKLRRDLEKKNILRSLGAGLSR